MLNLLVVTQAFQITLSTYRNQHITGLHMHQQHSIAALVINVAQ